MKRKLLFAIIWQITICAFASASTPTGIGVEYIPSSRNLGVGIHEPTTKLDINGQIMIRGGSPAAGKILSSDKNGKAAWATVSSLVNPVTFDTLNTSQFLRSDASNNFSSGILSTDSGTRFDVNGNLSITDSDISLDGANTNFTQSSGDISFNPASAKDLNTTITSGGEFKINTSDFVFNGTNARVGIGNANPSTKLDVNGTIRGTTINGTNANFTNLSSNSLNNTGGYSFSKIIASNNINGSTANFNTGNFTDLVVSGTLNGTSTSFDGDYTNGSILFSNNQGVISQDNNHFYWDRTNNRLGLGLTNPNQVLTINGALSIKESSAPSMTMTYGELYSLSNHKLYYMDYMGGSYNLLNGSTSALTDATTLDLVDSSEFLRSDTNTNFSTGILTIGASSSLDINSNNLSIVDDNISLDGANTNFTQSSGNITLAPASGKNLNATISSGGEFKINSNDLVFNGTNARIGIGTSNPSTRLNVNGTIKGLNINGTSANFTNITTSSLNTTGTGTFNKVIVSNNINGATGNFTTGNISNLVVSGTINGSTTSFDGDFTNGSVFFANNQGVISQDNNHFYWDKDNKRLALNHKQPDTTLDVNGAIAMRNVNDGSIIVPGDTLTYQSSTYKQQDWSNPAYVVVNKPSGTVNGDLLIAFQNSVWHPDSHNTPSGWTLITSTNKIVSSGGLPLDWASHLSAYYKIASSEPSTYAFNGSDTNAWREILILRYDGHNPSNPINVSATSNGANTTGIFPMASVTTSVTNTKILKVVGASNNAGALVTSPNGYTQRNFQNRLGVVEKDQSAIGTTDTNGFTFNASTPQAGYTGITLAIEQANGSSTPLIPNPDEGSTFLYLSNGSDINTNAGDLVSKTTANSTTKTIRIIDFNNGKLATTADTQTIDGFGPSNFLRSDTSTNYSSGTLTFDAGTSLAMDASSSLDINSTNLSIADTNISLDGASTTFTQGSGGITLSPASSKDLTTTISSGNEFKINTNGLVFNGTTINIGIGTASPSTKLEVNGTIKGLVINGTSANISGTTNTNKLISSGLVNGTDANFTTGNFSNSTNTGKLIASGTVNGSSANFTTGNFTNLTYGTGNITTLNSTTINNSGTINSAKLISSGVVNGTTLNINKVIASGTINGANANFTNINATNFNGSNFDSNFTNGSILFSNAAGVISENNPQLHLDRTNNKTAIGLTAANEKLTLNGVLAIKEGAIPSTTSGFAKLYVNSSDSKLYFQNDSGISYNLNNGAIAAPLNPAGLDGDFQYNNGGYLAGNGALSFNKTNKTLQVAADAPLDINSTTVSIADNNINFNSASGVTFTPSAGQNLNISLSTTGDFTVNTNQLYLDTSSAALGLSISNPNEVLTINGTLSLKEGSAASSTSNFGKLYVKSSDSKIYFKKDSGTEYSLTSPTSTNSINSLSDAITSYPTYESIYIGDHSGINNTTGYMNTAIGATTLNGNTTGAGNTAFGNLALAQNFNGSANSAFGMQALTSNTRGSHNTSAGFDSMLHNTTGVANTAAGTLALLTNVKGQDNTALGYQALVFNTNGSSNTACGINTLYYNTVGNGNVAIGNLALEANRSGYYNTAVGTMAARNVSFIDSYNTSLGYGALANVSQGGSNTAAGTYALASLENGARNVALGFEANIKPGTNMSNIFTSNGVSIGYRAGRYNLADNNIFIGYYAGNGNTSESNNILIGNNNNDLPSGVNANQLDIADTIYGDLSNHNVGIGTASIDTKLEVNGTTMTNLLVSKAFYTNSSASNVTINWNNGNEQKITLGHSNVTFAFTDPSAGVATVSLILKQDATGSRTVTWPASVKWPGGTPPTLSTTANYVDIVSCVYEASTYLCQIGLDFR